MKARQWTLLGALGLTLAATWWAAQVEEDGAVEGDVAGVVEPAARAQRAPAAVQRPRAPAADAAFSGELAIIREPWPADASTLLQPALAGAAMPIDKGLSLPLPRDALYRPLVAAFWMDLVSGFLARADFELAVLVNENGPPRLVIGFNGADGNILHSVLDARAARGRLIEVDDAEWVEDQLSGDYALNKLASYLDRGDLSLRSARQVFRETFLGA